MFPFKKMDNSYCLIRLVLYENIALYCFQVKSKTYNYPICFTAHNADKLYKIIFIHKMLKNISLKHCIYLGQELYKAELCLKFGQEYIQN
uniref:Ycf91 n=1 Tax=Anunuuluaehu liula TaxID=3049639 RepID=UPI00300296A1